MHLFVDSSNNNRTVIPSALKRAGARGMYLKVSQGPGFVDAYYRERKAACRAIGLPVGGYHFGEPAHDAVEQARHFVSLLGRLSKGDLLPCLDIEISQGRTAGEIHAWAMSFCAVVHQELGVWPVIYGGEYFLKENNLLTLNGPKWVASYGALPSLHWDAWQYSDGQARYGRSLGGLDTSETPHIAALQYKPAVRHRVSLKVRRARLRAWILARRHAGRSWAWVKRQANYKAYRKIGGK